MRPLPPLSGEEVVARLGAFGFHVERRRSSHVLMTDGRHVVLVPLRDCFTPTQVAFLLDVAQVRDEEFLRALEEPLPRAVAAHTQDSRYATDGSSRVRE
jgi:predicted RNA binding protein YcfA (HicA-like mRNA interferase family)